MLTDWAPSGLLIGYLGSIRVNVQEAAEDLGQELRRESWTRDRDLAVVGMDVMLNTIRVISV